tara:strand:+ start:585 stop:1157 length:573 start_codon:yes stop_codon:yes gene_type:complete
MKKHGPKPVQVYRSRIDVIHKISKYEGPYSFGCPKDSIGQEVSAQLYYIPFKARVSLYIQYKYVCKHLVGVENNWHNVPIARMPNQIGPKSIVPLIVNAKFADAPPFYCPKNQFTRMSIEFCRSTMCKCAMTVADVYETLINLMNKMACSLIDIDPYRALPPHKADKNFIAGPVAMIFLISYFHRTGEVY